MQRKKNITNCINELFPKPTNHEQKLKYRLIIDQGLQAPEKYKLIQDDIKPNGNAFSCGHTV